MGAWRENNESEKPGNSSDHGAEVIEKKGAAQKRVAQRIHSKTVHDMRGVLGRLTTGAPRRIFNSAKCLTRSCVRRSEDKRKPARWCSGESVRIAVGRPGFIPKSSHTKRL